MSDRLMFRVAVVALAIAIAALLLGADWMEDRQIRLTSFTSMAMLGFGLIQLIRFEGAGKIPAYKLRPVALSALVAIAVMAALWIWGATGGTQSEWFVVAMTIAPAALLIGGAIYGGTRKPPG